MVQAARANSVGALFVFLHLLECHAERIGESGLAQIEHEPTHPHATTNVLVSEVEQLFHLSYPDVKFEPLRSSAVRIAGGGPASVRAA